MVKPTRRGFRSFLKRQHHIPALVCHPRQRKQSTSRGCDSRNLTPVTPAPLKTTLCVLNARSVRNKATDVGEYILDNDVDILALTETWLKDDDNVIQGNCTPAGYTFQFLLDRISFLQM